MRLILNLANRHKARPEDMWAEVIFWWVVLASAVVAGLITMLITSAQVPLYLKAVMVVTVFLAWAGGIATARLYTETPPTSA